MKKGRFWMFAYESRTPRGGLGDLELTFDNIEEYENEVKSYNKKNIMNFEDRYDIYELLDTKTDHIIWVPRYRLQEIKDWVIENK